MIKEFKSLNLKKFHFNLENAICISNFSLDPLTVPLEILKLHGLVFLDHHMRLSWWESLCRLIEDRDMGGIIVLDHLPDHWKKPKKCRVVGIQSIVDNTLSQWVDLKKKFPMMCSRKIESFQHSFFFPVGSTATKGRVLMQHQLRLLKVSERALTSIPATQEKELGLDEDPFFFNEYLAKGYEGHGFDGPVRSVELEFNHALNARNMILAHQKCHFAIAMDTSGDWMDTNGFLTEKMLWAFWTGVPVLWLTNREKRKQLESWGFRDSSDGLDSISGPAQKPLQGWVADISLLERLVMDSMSSQQWQDAQGERVYNNRKKIEKLREVIDELQWQEWQKIK